MRIFVLIFLCVPNFCFVYSQATNMGITKRFEGLGKIDEYEITFILDVITHPYYIDGDHVGEIQQFSGKYAYNKHKKDIFLYGTRLVTFTQGEPMMNDSIKLYEVDEMFNKVAVFNGVLSKTFFQGKWNSFEGEKHLTFKILFDESKFTLLKVETSKGFITLPFNNLNNYNQNEHRIIKIIEKNDKTYILISLALTVCGALKARGSGCGGHDVFLRLYEVDTNSCKYSEMQLMGQSFIYFKENADKDEYTVSVKQLRNDVEIDRVFKVNFNKIEDGIKEVKL